MDPVAIIADLVEVVRLQTQILHDVAKTPPAYFTTPTVGDFINSVTLPKATPSSTRFEGLTKIEVGPLEGTIALNLVFNSQDKARRYFDSVASGPFDAQYIKKGLTASGFCVELRIKGSAIFV